MSIASRLACASLAALTLGAPATASACWDGVSIGTERMTLSIPTDVDRAEWTAERARSYAKWAGRLDALIPEGKTVSVEFGWITICDVAADSCTEHHIMWEDDYLPNLFEILADATEASNAKIMAARRLNTKPLTVQVAASSSLYGAEALAERINEQMLGLNGFLDIGGFPAINDDAHVVESYKGDRVTYHVVVGSFLERDKAKKAADTLEHDLGLKTLVRTLDQSSVEDVGC